MRGSRPAPRHARRSAAPASTPRSPSSCSNSSPRWRSRPRSRSQPSSPSAPPMPTGSGRWACKRAEHAAEAARRRYLAVDPTNRLVADQLEADWNNKLRELADAKRRVRARHPGRQPAAHRRAASPDPRARDRPTRTVGQPGDPDARTQAADPPARHRRHAEQDRRADHRARPPLRRPTAHAAGATAAAGVGGAHHATHHDRADRPTAQRSHLRRDGRDPQRARA